MKKLALYWLAIGTIVLAACQKETSFELGTAPGSGSLQSDATGDCLPKTISGTYVAGTPLVPTVSTMTVSVNVTKTGTYLITTDTVNGYFFNATGTFTTLGPTNVTLRSSGTPFAAGINNFVVSYDGTICDIQVTVLPAGTGPATFTLAGAPAACTTPSINGSYIQGTALTAANTVVLNVNVTVAGSYNVTTGTAVNGMIFSGTGTVGTGAQTITLTGTGTPATATSTPIPVTVGASTCTFTINVVGGAVGTLDGGGAACAPIIVGGTYTVGTALTAANTVQVRIDVTSAGPYSITATSPTAGFSFAKTGTAVVGNDQLITLDPVGGPPTASGLQTFTVTFGSSTCTFTITVGGAAGAAVGTLDGAPTACTPVNVAGTYTQGTALTAANTVQVRVDVTTAGTYTIAATSPTAGFGFTKSGSLPVGNDQLITLDAAGGPPTASGLQTFTVTFGTSSCTFTINVVASGGGSAWVPNCGSAVVDGLYEATTQLNPSNTVDIEVNVTATGPYVITTAPVNGMTFSASGNFASTGTTTIQLVGSGTPTNEGTFNITMPGTTTCTFQVIVDPTPTIHWKFTVTSPAPVLTYQGQTDQAIIQPATPPATGIVFAMQGSNSLGTDNLIIAINDVNSIITNGEVYTTTTNAAFEYTPAYGSDTYSADPTIAGANMTITVTNHNVATKTITGTFSGTAKNAAGNNVTITNGTFTATYP